MPEEPARQVRVPCKELYKVEQELEHLKKELKELIDRVPSKFRKQVRTLSEEANHIQHDVESIKGLHWAPPPQSYTD